MRRVGQATVRKMSDLVVRACKVGNQADLESALDASGDVDAKDSYGFSGLHHCAGKNYVDCMQILIRRGADVNVTVSAARPATATVTLTVLLVGVALARQRTA